MPRARQVPDLAPRKRPSQARSRATVAALVDAAAGLLAERGYARTTTNHIASRAGVNVASLYEYFPGKDALVAQVAERLVERVLARLADGAARVRRGDEAGALRRWIGWIHDSVAREKALVAVFVYEVPYTDEIAAVQTLRERLVEFSRQVREHAGGFVRPDFTEATLHLVVNLVSSTILQLVLEPPRDVGRQALLDELADRLDDWIRDPRRSRRRG